MFAEVSGDFTAEATVLHLDEAKPESVLQWIENFPACHAATLLTRRPKLLGFEQASMHRDANLSLWSL
jgi:hypothetical protein